MEQTPLHHQHNPDLLAVMPAVGRVVEAGCSSGALAAAYKQLNAGSYYTGIEIDPSYAAIAQAHCDAVLVVDLDALADLPRPQTLEADCWVFGDCLEHLVDPWRLLRWVHGLQPAGGVICACIPNAQHWSLQARLSRGDFRYEASGLLDRTHLRWFTRETITDLFAQGGYRIRSLQSRVISREPDRAVMEAIGALAAATGGDPLQAAADANTFQFVVVAERVSSCAL